MNGSNRRRAAGKLAPLLAALACVLAAKWTINAYSSPSLVGELLLLFRLCG